MEYCKEGIQNNAGYCHSGFPVVSTKTASAKHNSKGARQYKKHGAKQLFDRPGMLMSDHSNRVRSARNKMEVPNHTRDFAARLGFVFDLHIFREKRAPVVYSAIHD